MPKSWQKLWKLPIFVVLYNHYSSSQHDPIMLCSAHFNRKIQQQKLQIRFAPLTIILPGNIQNRTPNPSGHLPPTACLLLLGIACQRLQPMPPKMVSATTAGRKCFGNEFCATSCPSAPTQSQKSFPQMCCLLKSQKKSIPCQYLCQYQVATLWVSTVIFWRLTTRKLRVHLPRSWHPGCPSHLAWRSWASRLNWAKCCSASTASWHIEFACPKHQQIQPTSETSSEISLSNALSPFLGNIKVWISQCLLLSGSSWCETRRGKQETAACTACNFI